MNMRAFVLGLGCVFVLAACNPAPAPAGGGGGAAAAEKRLADLEKSVGALQAQNTDLRAKLGARNSFPGRSPIDDFFASPEFWECTYDSSWSDCSSRCSKSTGERNKLCLAQPEGPKRVQCMEQAAADGSACLKACPVQTSPISPPGCIGGGPA
jgi:hypothetical protein